MERLSMSTMPKWMGLIPIILTTGNKMGVVIRMRGAISIMQPSIRRSTLMTKRITYLLSDMDMRADAARSGILRYASIQPKALEVAIRPSTMAKVPRDLLSIREKLERGTSR